VRALVAGTPLWVANWTDPEFASRLRALVRSWRPQVVQLEFHVMGQYLPLLAGERCLRILVEHEPGHVAALERWRNARGPIRWARAIDARAWERFERAVLAGVDAVVAFTDEDVGRLAALSPPMIVAIRPGIHVPARPLDSAGREREIVFIGNFTHPPNLDAALRLATTIHPRVRAHVPGVRLTIVGDQPPPELRALATTDVAVTGRVPDVAPILDRAAVVVAPLRLGGGIRVKILEALAAGKAVVASSLAMEGLAVTTGEQCIIADTDEAVAAAIVTLLEDAALRSRVGEAARQWAAAHLGWAQTVAAYDALYDRLLGDDTNDDIVVDAARRPPQRSAGGAESVR